MDGKAPLLHSSGSFFLQPGRQVGMVKTAGSLYILPGKARGPMLEALQQLYIFLAKQTMFTAVFLNSSLVQQLKYIVLNKQPEF